ncbi:hypothetical protein [Nonomuraea typhae]|uniref:hypothetical protein n=1 Tax=Nonomuraea typhae TaxID=2603600 RepID=UPI0012FAB3BB|nr:hypothetical protein [Nonomuraea typhae]
MSQHLIRDEYGNEFPVDSTALPFWENREGHTIVGPIPEPGDEPEPAEATKTTKKAAPRPASEDKE